MTGHEIVRKKRLKQTRHKKAEQHKGRRFQQNIPRGQKDCRESIYNNNHDHYLYLLHIII